MKAYVRAGLNLIMQRARTQTPQSKLNADDLFFLRLGAADDLARLPEYLPCMDALVGDPRIAEQLDVMAGNNSRRTRSPSAEQLMKRVLDLSIKNGRYEFDEEYFEREYAAFEEAYYSPELLYEVVAPLQGLLIDSPVSLSDDLEISQLKGDELNQNRRSRNPSASRDPLELKLCAIRSGCRLPKIVGDDVGIDLEAAKKDDAKRAETNDRVEQVVNALRLYGVESVYPLAIIHRTNQWSFGHEQVFPGRFQPDIHFSTEVDVRWLNSFKQFWDVLQSGHIKNRKFLDVAIRRFSYAHERHRLEDKIVDLLIAAEALFLSDYNKDDPYIGEIRYRLSLRAALFLGSSTDSQRMIFRQMRAAYDLRSKIAHGGDAENVKLPKQPDNIPTQLEDFVWTIQSYIRLALRKAIDLAVLPETPMDLVKWDELIFK